ncbi:hypothetical protein [Priestia flexa]|uniref:Transposase n=1 Tax=Priestia flexa TaxID=86664 RepID=A0ABU4J268_9BACI|nr:hypothetical protein [Priestia flexa]MDW8515088.1 hypothetical protein [Priestia flexa]
MTKVQKKVFSKETYQLMAETKTDTEIAREFGIKQPTLAYHKKKWFGGKQDAEKIQQPDQEYQKLMGELKVQLDKKKVTVEQLEDKIHQLTETVLKKNERMLEIEQENERLKVECQKWEEGVVNINKTLESNANAMRQLAEENDNLKNDNNHLTGMVQKYRQELASKGKSEIELQEIVRTTVKQLAQYI